MDDKIKFPDEFTPAVITRDTKLITDTGDGTFTTVGAIRDINDSNILNDANTYTDSKISAYKAIPLYIKSATTMNPTKPTGVGTTITQTSLSTTEKLLWTWNYTTTTDTIVGQNNTYNLKFPFSGLETNRTYIFRVVYRVGTDEIFNTELPQFQPTTTSVEVVSTQLNQQIVDINAPTGTIVSMLLYCRLANSTDASIGLLVNDNDQPAGITRNEALSGSTASDTSTFVRNFFESQEDYNNYTYNAIADLEASSGVANITITNFNTFNPSTDPITSALADGTSCSFLANGGITGYPPYLSTYNLVGRITRQTANNYIMEVMSVNTVTSTPTTYPHTIFARSATRIYNGTVVFPWYYGSEYTYRVSATSGYTKYPDGTMEQWGVSSGNTIISFPTPFIMAPHILTGSGEASATSANVFNYDTLTASYFNLVPRWVNAGAWGTSAVSFYWIAKGRWY